MRRPSLLPFLLVAAVAVCLLSPGLAWAKYAPPPLQDGQHVVTEVGWLSPADLRKLDDEAEVANIKTGFVIDVLLAKGDEPIDEVANATFQAWKPGDPGKDNGILLVLQPNFPRGERKARLQVGKAVQALMTPAKARDLLRDTIGPFLNGSDEVRAAVAEGVQEIARIVGSGERGRSPADAAAPAPSASASEPVAAPAAPAPAAPAAPAPAPTEGSGSTLQIVLGAGLLVALGFLAFRRLGGASKAGKKS